MRTGILAAIAFTGLSFMFPAAAQQGGELSGTWQGPWYRGMTSGVVTIAFAGTGTIQFTNLENFGDDAVALENVEVAGNLVSFTATGKSGAVFSAKATLSAEGSRLRGNGRYEGFGVRFEGRPLEN